MAGPPHSTPKLHPHKQKCSLQDITPPGREPEKMALNCHMLDLGDPGEAKVFIYSVIPQKLIKKKNVESQAWALESGSLGLSPDSALP